MSAPRAERPINLSDLLDFSEVTGPWVFDQPDERAIAYFIAKGLTPTFSYADMVGQAHDHAFTVAKMMQVDLLAQMRASLDSALANGTPFKEWADSIIPTLQKAGWWGRANLQDPLTGATVDAQLGSAHRLETIFRTNLQSAYAAGAWAQMEAQADDAPYLMYDAIDDDRTRPSHRARDGVVLPLRHPWWDKNYPPLGYSCRCGVIQMTRDEAEAVGFKPSEQPPPIGTYEWKNPRTGEVLTLPSGVDPGFDRNPGKELAEKLQETLKEKVDQLPASLKQAQATIPDLDGKEAERQAAAQASVDKAIAKTKALQQEQDAAAALKALRTGRNADPMELQALKALESDPAWLEQRPLAQLQAVKAEAQARAQAATKAALVEQYRAATVAGQIPSQEAAAAFKALSKQEKAEILKAVMGKPSAPPKAKSLIQTLTDDQAAPSMDDLVQIGPKAGTNPGGLFQNPKTGARWYIKWPGNEDRVRNEVLAGRLYRLAGVETPDTYIVNQTVNQEARYGVASRYRDGLVQGNDYELAQAPGTGEGFAADAWLGNWDVVGFENDNLLISDGRAFRVDVGGSLRYRAQGGQKGELFGDKVYETESLLDASINPRSAGVFDNITEAQKEAGVERLLRTNDDDIKALVDAYGPTNEIERTRITRTLLARKRDLADQYPSIAQRVSATQGPKPKAAPKPQGRKVSQAEQDAMLKTGVSGYEFKADGLDIEDHSVLIHRFYTADGKPRTKAFLKVRPRKAALITDELEKRAPDKGWRRESGAARFPVTEISGRQARQTKRMAEIVGAVERHELRGLDDERATFILDHERNHLTLRGVLSIDVPGDDIKATERLFQIVADLGIDASAPSATARKHLYVNAYARLLSTAKTEEKVTQAARQVLRMAGETEDDLTEKLRLLKSATGNDIVGTEGWRSLDGIRPPTGGRSHILRPDLNDDDIAALEEQVSVFHNVAMGPDEVDGVFEKMKPIFSGGGNLASMLDRLRRGLAMGGSSPSDDIQSGGGSYVFTRLLGKQDDAVGLYWNASVLRRMDAITYREDLYGEVTERVITTKRHGATRESLLETAGYGGNETLFKTNLSLFDGLEHIVLKDEDEVQRAIRWLQEQGYFTWPDGRDLKEVVITVRQQRAKYR